MLSATLQLYKNSYAGISKRIWLLSLVMLINRSGTMVLAFMTLYCIYLGFTLQQAGIVVAIYGLGAVAGAFFGGRISDKFGFYYTQVGALMFGGVLFIIVGQLRGYEAICTGTFFLSMVNESFRPANATAITHYSDAKTRTQSFSLVRLAINLGWGVGSALGGIMASIHYPLLFWADGITCILAAIVLLILLPRVTLAQQKSGTAPSVAERKAASPYKDKTFLYFLLLQVFFSICFFQMFTTIPVFFKKHLLLNEFWIGVVMAVNGVIIALIEMVLVYKLEGRKPYLLLMCQGTLLMGLAYLLLNVPIMNGIMMAMVFILIITLAEMIGMPFMNSYYIARSSDNNRGQYAGLYTMSWSVAQVIGSSIGALVAFQLGYTNFWFLISGICVLTAIGYYALLKKS